MFSNVISLVLRDSDTDSENVSWIRWPENMLFKGCVIDRHIIKCCSKLIKGTDMRDAATYYTRHWKGKPQFHLVMYYKTRVLNDLKCELRIEHFPRVQSIIHLLTSMEVFTVHVLRPDLKFHLDASCM